MYNPVHFREERTEVLHDLIRHHSLATLVTLGANGLCANHIPMILNAAEGGLGTLRGHLARANSDWRESIADKDALVIFQGPSAYITPTWYPGKEEHGKVVPTHNYVVVHARGRVKMFDDPKLLAEHVRALTHFHEMPFPQKWSVDDAPPDFIDGMLKGIVGIEIPIAHLEGKWKVNQNKSAADLFGASEGLRALGNASSIEMANAIASKIPGSS